MPILPPAALAALQNAHPEQDFLLLNIGDLGELGPLDMQIAKPTDLRRTVGYLAG
ncbi:hypothetical protein GJ699_25570 [Duganella sp. FT80W]|uniref:Uncharacterized protein n=1 Tax=Duganella guangzhouensis TaxID=2666084 RepID=A0A6I2L6D8_9BURK|nr:hypothetical protein [Duganella guangzhouensis]MRW93363.1 hypothetical protein [Duganella guangzhouensis]